MFLKVEGSIIKNVGQQTILVKYDPTSDVTRITIDADAVTLGIAAKVLENRYTRELDRLEKPAAEDIKTAISKFLEGL